MARRALITGICGMDGSYLAELLLGKGYEVHGLVTPFEDQRNIFNAGIENDVELHVGDLADSTSLGYAFKESQPDEVYNLGAISSPQVCGRMPAHAENTNHNGPNRILSLVTKDVRFFQASSCLQFAPCEVSPQNEGTPFAAGVTAPYVRAKRMAHQCIRTTRELGFFTVCGILYNHESTRRPPEYVSRKITFGVARMTVDPDFVLELGNLDARRDWGHARDYVRAMWMMLQADKPKDYIIASGKSRTVREFVQTALDAAGLPWDERIQVNPAFYREETGEPLCGDTTRIQEDLGWEPEISFEAMVGEMVEHDLRLLNEAAAIA